MFGKHYPLNLYIYNSVHEFIVSQAEREEKNIPSMAVV